MLQDLELGRPLEIEAILGAVVEMAGWVDVAAPCSARPCWRWSARRAAIAQRDTPSGRLDAHAHPDIALGPTDRRHHLHGDDRQPAIWLDIVRAADQPRQWLGPPRHPGGVYRIRPVRDLAVAAGRLRDRPDRAPLHCRRRRRADRRLLGGGQRRHLAAAAVCRVGDRRCWGRIYLRRHRRQRAEMVPGPAGPGRRAYRGRLWRRFRPHAGADLQHDRP